jgi:peptidoglycan/LPS O-acetylase OafA/YrhL
MKLLTLKTLTTRLIRSHGSTDHATLLRALAALSVVFVHYNGFSSRDFFAANSYPYKIWNFTINLGIYGPTIFFIASGFALTASLDKKRIVIRKFIVRRYFRLAPLYISILLCYFVLENIFTDFKKLQIGNFLLKIFFLDAFFPRYFYNDPVGVLATLPIEFWWSFSIPILIWITKRFGFAADLVAGILFLYLGFGLNKTLESNSYIHAFPVNAIWTYGLCFYLGFQAFRIRQKYLKLVNNFYFLASIVATNVLIESVKFSFLLNIYLTSSLFLIMFNFDILRKKFLVLSLIGLSFGTFCYSIYLVHLPIRKVISEVTSDALALNLTSIILILVISPVTYLYIELRGISVGEKISNHLFKEAPRPV